jgi:hypothetical protein
MRTPRCVPVSVFKKIGKIKNWKKVEKVSELSGNSAGDRQLICFHNKC